LAKKPTEITAGGKRKHSGQFTGKDDPRRHPGWPKGVSGNPSGYPKDRAEAAKHMERRLREEFLDQAVDAIKYHATKGSVGYMIEALNRMLGKVADKTELTGSEGAPIEIKQEGFADAVRRIAGLSNKEKDNGK
jgi:hypothetical protein